MEMKGQSLIPIFMVILILGFASGFIRNYRRSLFFFLAEQDAPDDVISVSLHSLSLVTTAFDPFMVLIIVYFAGRNIDLKSKLVPLIVLILVGSYVGNFLGYVVASLIVGLEFLSESVLMGLTYLPFSRFFVVFTALSLAYIRRRP